MSFQMIPTAAKRANLRQLAKTRLLGLTFCSLLTMPVHADWQLIGEASELSFVSVKAAHLAEQHHFKTVTGTVSDDGEAHLIVDLASVHTGIDIRDQRMRDMFFKVAEFPTADFYSSVDVATAADLTVGESVDIPLVGKVRVHRIFADVKTVVTAVKLTEDRIMLTSKEPIAQRIVLGFVRRCRDVAIRRKPSGNQLGRAHNLSVTVSKPSKATSQAPHSCAPYWAFYWPLALTAVGMVLSIQFQNATLARYPEAVTELAILALSLGVFRFFNASQQFIAQLSNVYARSAQGSRRAWRFVVVASLVITAPLLLLATLPQGADLISLIFSINLMWSTESENTSCCCAR